MLSYKFSSLSEGQRLTNLSTSSKKKCALIYMAKHTFYFWNACVHYRSSKGHDWIAPIINSSHTLLVLCIFGELPFCLNWHHFNFHSHSHKKSIHSFLESSMEHPVKLNDINAYTHQKISIKRKIISKRPSCFALCCLTFKFLYIFLFWFHAAQQSSLNIYISGVSEFVIPFLWLTLNVLLEREALSESR